MTPSTVIFLLAFSLIANDIIPSEARYKYSRRRASRFLRHQRRQIDEEMGGLVEQGISASTAEKLSDLLIAAVSTAISTVVNEQPLANCPDLMGRQGDVDDVLVDDEDPDLLLDDDSGAGLDAEDEIIARRLGKRRLLRSRRRNRNTNVNVNQNYNMSARKEEGNDDPSEDGSEEDESSTEPAMRHRRRNFK